MNASICIPHSLNHRWHSQISGFNTTEKKVIKNYSIQLEVIIFLTYHSKIYLLTFVKLIIQPCVIYVYHFQVFPYGKSSTPSVHLCLQLLFLWNSLYWDTNICSGGQEIPHLLWNPQVHCCVHLSLVWITRTLNTNICPHNIISFNCPKLKSVLVINKYSTTVCW